MFRKFLVLAAFGLASINAQAVVINFEDLAGVGAVNADRYQSQGVVFNGSGYSAYNHSSGGANTPGYSLAGPGYAGISAYFTSSVSNLSILIGDWCCDLDSATLTAYDSNGAVLGSMSGSGDSWFTLAVNASGISSFAISASGAVLYDNLTFSESSGVPAPGVLSMLMLGMFGIFATRRRAS